MTTTPEEPLNDDDMATVPAGGGPALGGDADGTDGDATDTTAGDATDSDGTDSDETDGDATDTTAGDSSLTCPPTRSNCPAVKPRRSDEHTSEIPPLIRN